MKTLYPLPPDPSTDPVYLAAAAVHSLLQPLPSGTAFNIGIVLIVMMIGRLVQTKGSLARAVLPFVVHLRWGWHRVERAMERGRSEEHTSELQSLRHLVCRLLLEKKKNKRKMLYDEVY